MASIHHIGVYVRDLERSRQFFEKYFGARCGELYHNPRKSFSSYMLSFDSGARMEIMTRPGLTDPAAKANETGNSRSTSPDSLDTGTCPSSLQITSHSSPSPDTSPVSTAPSPCIGYAHISICVGDRDCVDSLTRRLAEDGFPLIDGPRTTGDGYYESVILDPDGNLLELTASPA